MNFKKPRDPNTDPHLKQIRVVHPSEGITCEVGSGECVNLAIESQDNGYGGEFFLCEQHSKEFRDLAALIAEMTPNQVNAFADAIGIQENK